MGNMWQLMEDDVCACACGMEVALVFVCWWLLYPYHTREQRLLSPWSQKQSLSPSFSFGPPSFLTLYSYSVSGCVGGDSSAGVVAGVGPWAWHLYKQHMTLEKNGQLENSCILFQPGWTRQHSGWFYTIFEDIRPLRPCCHIVYRK